MNLILDEPIYRWLQSLSLILSSDAKKLKNNKFQLQSSISELFQNGNTITNLLKHYFVLKPNFEDKKIINIISRQFNWQLIVETVKKEGWNIDSEMIKLIISGDTPLINDFLKEFHEKYGEKSKKIKPESLEHSNVLFNSETTMDKKFKSLDVTNLIEINSLNPDKNIEKSDNLLEFLVIILANKLSLKANQAATLFTKNSKYLSQILAKGVKGEFGPIIDFYSELSSKKSLILKLIQKDPSTDSLIFFLQSLKAGLVSKDLEVSNFTCQFFTNIYDSSLDLPLFSWLIENGFTAFFLCLKRNPSLTDLIFETIHKFANYDINNFYSTHLRKILVNDEDFMFFLRKFAETQTLKKFANNELENWREFAFLNLTKSVNLKNNSFIFLVESLFSDFNNVLENKIYEFIKENANINNSATLNIYLIQLCRMIEKWPSKENYNVLNKLIIENINQSQFREYFYFALLNIFEKINFELLSSEILQFLFKKIDKNFNWNICDFLFFENISKNEIIAELIGNSILEIFSKIYLNSHIYAPCAGKILMILLPRQMKNIYFQDLVIKFMKLALSIYFTLSRKQKTKKRVKSAKAIAIINDSKDNKGKKGKIVVTLENGELTEKEIEILNSQKKNLILSLIKQIIELNHENFNERAKELIGQSIMQMKKYISKKPNKGLMNLLLYWGVPEKIAIKLEADYYEKLEINRKKKKEDESLRILLETDNISRISGESENHALSLDLDFNSLTDPSDLRINTLKKGVLKRRLSIGSPVIKKGLSRAETIKMQMLRHPILDPKVQSTLENIKSAKKTKENNIQKENIEQNKKIDKLKINIRKQIEKKHIEMGIAPKLTKDLCSELIFPLDSKKKENEKKFNIVDFLQEEDFVVDLIELIWNKNLKFLKFVFFKYANTAYRTKRPEYFEEFNEKTENMSAAEIIKLFKEHEILSFLDVEIIKELIKEINGKFFGKKEVDFLEFSAFKPFLINISIILYGNDKIEDLHNKIISFSFEKLINKLILAPCNNYLKGYFSEQKEINDKINEIKQKLKNDKDFIIPDDFIKITEPQIELNYNLFESLPIPESFKISYEIINDILNNSLKFNLIEPQSKTTLILSVKKKNNQNFKKYHSEINQIVNEIIDKTVKMTEKIPETKLKEKKIKKIKNKNKTESSEIIKPKEIIKKRELETVEKFSKSKEKKEQNEKIKNFWEKKRKQQNEFKLKLSETKKNKQEEEKKIEELKSIENQKEQEKKNKNNKDFNQKQIQKIKKHLKEIINKRKTEIESKEKEEKKQESIKKRFISKLMPLKMEEFQKNRLLIQNNYNLLNSHYETPIIQSFFSKHLTTIRELFSHLLGQSYTPLNFKGFRDTLPLNTLLKFCNDFNICPLFFDFKDVIVIYKNLLKDKIYVEDNIVLGLNFEDFKECFFRYAVKGNKKLNKISEFLEINNKNEIINEEINNKEINFEQDENKIIEKNKNYIPKYYDIEKTTNKTLEAFLYYLGMPIDPKDKNKIKERFRNILNGVKIKPTKYRKLELQKKLEGEGYDNI